MGVKEFMFIAVATAVAIILVEPLFENVLKSVAPGLAAKAGIS